jgi:predicted TIM-barrel fold metal-dependent hydrolase
MADMTKVEGTAPVSVEREANRDHVSRRALLGTAAATFGATALSPVQSLFAQHAEAAAKRKGAIDVHYHLGQRRAPGKERPNLGRFGNWTPELAVEDMDRGSVAVGLLSSAAGGGLPDPRKWNETAAQLGRDYPGRFGLLAALLMTDVDASLKEIEYSTSTLKADGFGILTSYGDSWLGDDKFHPIYEELNRRKAVIFVHPTDAPCCTAGAKMNYIKPPMNGSWLEWPMDTARTIFSLAATGTLRAFPDIKFIFAHSGGVMPLFVDRLIGMSTAQNFGPEVMKSIFPEGIEKEIQRCYFEIAQGYAPFNMAGLKRMVPASHILFGSDYPFFMPSLPTEALTRLPLSSDEQRAIVNGNAEMLFPHWKA